MEESLGFFATLSADAASMMIEPRHFGALLLAFFMRLDFLAVFLFRASSWCRKRGWLGRVFAFIFWRLNVFVSSCDIHVDADIAPGLSLPHPMGVVIGPVKIGKNAVIHQNVTMGRAQSTDEIGNGYGRAVIGDDVVVYAGAVLIGAVKVGDKAQIGANAVVVSDVPEGATAFAMPARCLARQN